MERAHHTIYIGFFLMEAIAIVFGLSLYVSPFSTMLVITGISIVGSFLFALNTNDYSWTDRLWSIMPAVFAWILTIRSDGRSALLLPTLLITCWAIRLTYNFARKGGYSGIEDYRWSILHRRIANPKAWTLFSFCFIAAYQQLLFVAFTSPLLILQEENALPVPSRIWAVAMAGFLLLELSADNQQWRFQMAKRGKLPRKADLEADYERGFSTTGLFSRCRHPNYLGELGFWWSLYFYAVTTVGKILHPTIVGALLLTVLFIGSTRFTESITSGKYRAYEAYRRRTWAIVPRPMEKERNRS